MATPPSASEQAIIDLLKKSFSELKKISAGTNRPRPPGGRRGKSRDTLINSIERLEVNTNKFNKEISKSQKEISKASKLFNKSLLSMVKDALLPANKRIKEVLEDFSDEFSNLVDRQAADKKELAKGTRDYIKANKKAITNIKNSATAFKDYNNLIKNISKNRKKIEQDDIDKVQKFFKVIDQLSRSSRGKVVADKDINYRQRLQLQLFLQRGQKLTRQELEKLVPILKKVGDNFGVISDVTTSYLNVYSKSIKELNKGFKDSMRTAFDGMKTAVFAAAPQIFKDLMSQARNAVQGSNYGQAARLGVSQEELSDFTGKNRLGLRAFGQTGKSSYPVDSGQINDLQNYSYKFGVTGNDSLKFIGQTLNNVVNMGVKPNIDSLKKQMDFLYESIQTTGATFDELNQLTSDLSTSPAFLQLAQAKGYDAPEQQLKVLTNLLTQERYSVDYLKQLLDLNKAQQYQGVEDAVKSMVGIDLLGGQVNKSLGYNSMSPEMLGLLKESTRGSAALIKRFNMGKYDDYKFNGTPIKEMFKGPTAATDFSAFATQLELKFNKQLQAAYAMNSASDGRIAGAVSNTLLNKFGGMAGPRFEQQESALVAEARLFGQTGSYFPGQDQKNVITGSNDTFVKSISDLTNAFVPLGKVTNELVGEFQEALRALGQNPGGKAAGGLWSAAKGIVGSIGTIGGILALGRMAPGGAGALGGLGGLLGKGGALLRSGGRAISGGLGRLGSLGGAALRSPISQFIGKRFLGPFGLGMTMGSIADYGTEKLTGKKLGEQIGAREWFGPLIDSVIKPNESSIQLNPLLSDRAAMLNPQSVGLNDTLDNTFELTNNYLKELLMVNKKLLETTQKASNENMQKLIANSNDEKIQQARNISQDILRNR